MKSIILKLLQIFLYTHCICISPQVDFVHEYTAVKKLQGYCTINFLGKQKEASVRFIAREREYITIPTRMREFHRFPECAT